MNKIIYAEEVPYWKTGTSSAESWIDKAKKEIRSIHGQILAEAFGADQTGKAAYMLGFKLGEEQFKIIWPVLPSKTGNTTAAKRQAATMLYHDVKAKVVTAKVMGVRTAFFSYLMLPNGMTATQLSNSEILQAVPDMMRLPSGER